MFNAIVAGAIGASLVFLLLVFALLVTSDPWVAAFYGFMALAILVHIFQKMARSRVRDPK